LEQLFDIPNDRLRVGIDTGGTFTDLVVASELTGRRLTVKVPSTPQQPSAAVIEALARTGLEARIDFFVLGTTVATNALLQRKGERTVYVTTAGFEDALFIQRINRRGLYDLQWRKPSPYVSRADCVGVVERVTYDGTVRQPLLDSEIERVIDELRSRPGAVAVNLLFSFVNNDHERRLAGAIRAAFPDRSVSAASEVAPIWREFERGNTVTVDASLKRLITDFADEIDDGLRRSGVRCPRFFLKSNGGQVTTAAAARRPVDLTLSGLAGGLIAGKFYADDLGLDSVVTLDMGGTSADVGLVLDRQIRSASQYEFEWGLPIIVPVVDLTTIGAGGSSIAGLDAGGLLKVGPESAGARPGPACYGIGGHDPTVTDANVVLGRLNPDYFLGGELRLDAERAAASLEGLGGSLELDLERTAQAVIELAVENMAGAVRLLCADRGVDYRSLDLMAFGGAGPLHASLIARRLGLRRVVIPPEPGLASAFGALVADLRVDRRVTRAMRSDRTDADELRTALDQLATETLEALHEEGDPRAPVVLISAGCRYVGQNYEQEVQVPNDGVGDLMQMLLERFHAQHETNYGYRLPDAPMEIVHLSATALDSGRPALTRSSGAADLGTAEDGSDSRRVFFKESGWTDAKTVRRSALPVGIPVSGPLLIEEHDSTVLVLAGQRATRHTNDALILELAGPAEEPGSATREGALVG
jgi:N-methylhydantoinase A